MFPFEHAGTMRPVCGPADGQHAGPVVRVQIDGHEVLIDLERCIRGEAEEGLELGTPVRLSRREIVVEGAEIGRPHRQPQPLLALAQGLLLADGLVDIDVRPVPAVDGAAGIAEGEGPREEPAILTIGPAEPEFHLIVHPLPHGPLPGDPRRAPVVRVDDLLTAAGLHLVRRHAQVTQPAAVAVAEMIV